MSKWDEPTRQRAMAIAEEEGASVASAETGVPSGTVRYWMHKAGKAGPPKGADPVDWAERKEQGAREAWDAAQDALASVRDLIESGDVRQAKDAALTMAILTDKSGVLETAAAQAEERQVRMDRARAELIAAVIRAVFADCAVPFDATPVRAVVRWYLLRQAGEEGQVVEGSAPEREAAAETVRSAVLRGASDEEVRAEARRRGLLEEEAQRALPAGPVAEGPRGEPERRPVRERLRERLRARERDVEPVEGELVDEGDDQEPARVVDPVSQGHWDESRWHPVGR